MFQYQVLTSQRVDTPIRNTSNLRGAYAYDIDNSYPQRVQWLGTKVPQAINALRKLKQFSAGQGLQGAGIEEIVNAGRQQVFYDKTNKIVKYLPLSRPETLADFYRKVVASLSVFNGVYVHVGFDKSGTPISYTVMDFVNMRIAAPDDPKHAGKIIWWNNWAGELNNNRRDLKDPVYYSPYTGDLQAVKAEMQEMGGAFPGQVYFVSYGEMIESGLYPISPLHSVLGVADTAWQLNIYTNSLVRNGMHQGQTLLLPFAEPEEPAKSDFLAGIKAQEGADKAGGTLVMWGMQEGTQLVTRQTTGHADQFRAVEEDLTRKIRMGVGIPIAIFGDAIAGKLGNTAEIKDAFELFNQETLERRQFAASAMRFLFENTGIAGIAGQDFEVEPLQFEGTTIVTPTQPQNA